MPRSSAVLLIVVAGLAAGPAVPAAPAPHPADSSAVAELGRQAASLRPQIQTPWVRRFLAAARRLPHIATRTVLHDSSRTHYY